MLVYSVSGIVDVSILSALSSDQNIHDILFEHALLAPADLLLFL